MTDKDKKILEIKEQRAAFVTYLEHDLKQVKKNFPNQVDFVLKNKDRSYNEVAKTLDENFMAIQ